MEWSEVEEKLRKITDKCNIKSDRCKENSERKIIDFPGGKNKSFKIKYGIKNYFKINLDELKQIFELIQKKQKYSNTILSEFKEKNGIKLPGCAVQSIGKLFELSGLINKHENSNAYILKNTKK